MVGVVGGEIRKQKTEKGFDVKNKTENTLMQRVSSHAQFTTFMPKPTKTENNLIDENIPYCVFRIWAIISFVGPWLWVKHYSPNSIHLFRIARKANCPLECHLIIPKYETSTLTPFVSKFL